MPRITSYTPPWLSRPSPGFDFFSPSSAPKRPQSHAPKNATTSTPLRTTAVRGTEIFHVVDNELRWTDLAFLKAQWEEEQTRQNGAPRAPANAPKKAPYRVLKVPGSLPIRQLLISPTGSDLAIITSHTIYVSILPDPSHLSSDDTTPLKLRSFQLGPTTHVVECSGVAVALWHPLGVNGNCLVTVTADAVVRVWDLNRDDRASFETPNLAVDLKKLANGRSTAEDFSPSKYGTRKGFSPDYFEMEVASACFGAAAQETAAGWGLMTLWVAMTEGDVYVICPLLPSSWQAPASMVSSLATSIRLDSAALDSMDEVSNDIKRASQQQLLWISEIEASIVSDESGTNAIQPQTFRRPSRPSSIPKLQGPFRLSPDPEQMMEIVDIQTLNPEPESSSNATDYVEDLESAQLQDVDLVCLSTKDGRIHICMSLSRIEPRWLPLKKGNAFLNVDTNTDNHKMLVIESISLTTAEASSYPVFTQDAMSSSRLLASHATGVCHIDVSPLSNKLQEEIVEGSASGTDFRMGMVVDDGKILCEQVISFPISTQIPSASHDTSACCNLLDSELGHFVLVSFDGQPNVITLDTTQLPDPLDETEYMSPADLDQIISTAETRQAYQPPPAFWTESSLVRFLDDQVHSRHRQSTISEIRLSPNTLNLLMDAHRVLSSETFRLGIAASDLFTRCERLQDEFKEQLKRNREIVEKVDNLVGLDDTEAYEGDPQDEQMEQGMKDAVKARLNAVRTTQEVLHQRYDELRRKLARLNGRPVTDRERDWLLEIEGLANLVLSRPAEDADGHGLSEADKRLGAAEELRRDLLQHFEEEKTQIEQGAANGASADSADAGFNVALDRRRARSVEIEEVLERQAALVDATKAKLERLLALAV